MYTGIHTKQCHCVVLYLWIELHKYSAIRLQTNLYLAVFLFLLNLLIFILLFRLSPSFQLISMPSHFALLQHCEKIQHARSLEGIDALLGE